MLKDPYCIIFDPFKDLKGNDIPRKTYIVFRACGRCNGTGYCNGLLCGQCLIREHVQAESGDWGASVELYAFELTEAEREALEPNEALGAFAEQLQHHQNVHDSRLAAEKQYAAGKTVVVRVRNTG